MKISKHFNFKVLLLIIMIGLLIGIIFLGIGLGLGKGKGNDEGASQSKIENSHEDNKNITTKTVEHKENMKISKSIRISISVVGNDYFYENERISLQEFICELLEIEEDVVIEIKDDDASLKSYDNLIKELKDKNFNYIEK